MKNLLLLFCLLIAGNAFAKIIRVNNQEPSVPQQNTYATLQEAYNNSQAGDTLYIEGTTDNYGSLILTKRLTLIGPGFFLTENAATQANAQPAVLHQLTLNTGSEGSKLIGLSISYTSTSRVQIATDNIEVSRCYFGNGSDVYLTRNQLNNISVQGCYFVSQPILWISTRTPATNFYFANNIVLGQFKLQDHTVGTIVNNVFVHNTFEVGASSVLDIHNNVLLGTNAAAVVLPAPQSSITNNITSVNQLGTANNNQANVAESAIFVGGDSPDAKYQIKANGPADNTGRNGVDVGAFGGPSPYRLSGLPGIPHIYQLTTDGYANEEGELSIEIKVNAN